LSHPGLAFKIVNNVASKSAFPAMHPCGADVFHDGGTRRRKLLTSYYAGSKTLPSSIQEKETHWPEVPCVSFCGTIEAIPWS